MPDSGMMSPPPHHPQPPFYSPPQPPPPGGGWAGEDSYHGYNGDNNGNPLPVNGGNYSMRGGPRSVSFSPHQNPNDPNNNSGVMMEEGNGGGGPMQNGGDMYQTPQQRDLFEEIRNGGGHWSQLLRQVVLTSPEDFVPGTPSTPGAKEDHLSGPDGESGMNGDGHGNNQVVPLQVVGGSENGQFVYVGITNGDINRWITVGYLQPGDIIIEIQGQQVAGYTQADVISLLHHCLRGNSATLTVAPRGSLGPELRSYLNTRFQKGSVDHALQGVVRDNLYLRTVPVTTRTPRPGEINGVDYTFLSVEEFMQLERDGSLLESGVYAGNHYGTPKPWARLTRTLTDNPSEGASEGHLPHTSMIMAMEMPKGPLLPGMHPSSEGKRRRNRSNVEALGAGGDEDGNTTGQLPSPPGGGGSAGGSGVELGPLPANWEMSYTDNGEVYFIDHNTGTSHWLDPRLSRVQKLSLEDCTEDELPFGWERIEDPHYGVYYIDHVNRRTQFENPVIQAKQAATTSKSSSSGPITNGNVSTDSECDSTSKFLPESNPPPPHNPPPQPPQQYFQAGVPAKRPQSLSGKPIPPAPNPKPQNRLSLSQRSKANELDNLEVSSAGGGGLRVKPVDHRPYRFFTRDPLQLIGERIVTTLVKSNRGLGFTIVGGDDDDGLDEFLQIKSVVTDGPAWNDGKLRTGDVLVTVNGTCVLGYTHQEMVAIFQSIAPGQDVQLEVCRGYPLPFDPADPNTEIVTTVAVAPIEGTRNLRPASPDSLTHSAHSLPELSNDKGHGGHQYHRPASVDLLLDSPKRYPFGTGGDLGGGVGGQVCIVTIVKGQQGFGFTIADSVTGQKVKKVLDQSHSGDLEEGDRLIALDGLDLRGLSHTQVVQILKDFPVGREASLTIQRTPPNSPYNGGSGVSSSPPKFFGAGAGRSKTPTAELARGRPRFRDNLPERPKTPQGGLEGRSEFMNGGDSSLYNGGNTAPPPGGGDLNWVELTIELQRRQEGFGFRIVGGTEEGSQVSVGHIVPGGAAALDGRLQSGDQLVFVEGCSVIGASHHSVVQLMARSANQGKVRLTVRRPVYSNSIGGSNTIGGGPASDTTAVVVTPIHSPTGGGGSIASMGSGSSAPPIHVTLKRQPSEGFGFVIISSASKAGATIGKIVEGSPADRCGELHVGDRILAVNNLDISQLHHTQVVQLIKESGFVLTLSVLPVMTPQTPQPSLGSPGQQASQSMQFTSSVSGMEAMENLSLKDSTDPGYGGPEGHTFGGDGETVFSVHLSRGNRGFGFSIRGGKEFQNMPLFVLRLADDGPAAMDGRMQVGDQILQINGINTIGMTHAQAIHLIKTGGASVHLLLRRGAVPFPFLNQMPSFSSGGFGSGSNGGQELEEQSLSNASNNNSDQQFISQSQSATQLYRDHHHHHAGF